jgi:hypothetical protein
VGCFQGLSFSPQYFTPLAPRASSYGDNTVVTQLEMLFSVNIVLKNNNESLELKIENAIGLSVGCLLTFALLLYYQLMLHNIKSNIDSYKVY